MAEITAQSVKQLRERTGLPIMDCKQALVESQGDEDKAIEILRKKGHAAAAKKAGRETSEGRIACFVKPGATGGIVELRCETAPVANGEDFRTLAADIARQVAEGNGAADAQSLLAQPLVTNRSHTVQDRIVEVQNRVRENMVVARFDRIAGSCGRYVHHNGKVGVLYEYAGAAGDELLADIGMHIAAMKPLAVRVDQLDPARVAKEREILTEQARSTGKPENIIGKIVDGRMRNFFAEVVLEEQPYVKDDKKTVGQVLKTAGVRIVRFDRWELGEQ